MGNLELTEVTEELKTKLELAQENLDLTLNRINEVKKKITEVENMAKRQIATLNKEGEKLTAHYNYTKGKVDVLKDMEGSGE